MNFFKKFSRYLFARRVQSLDLILVILAFLLASYCYYFDFSLNEAVRFETGISWGYMARQDADGNFYVIDSSHERVISFDRDQKVRFVIDSSSSGDLSYYDNIELSEDGLFVSASCWDGMTVSAEGILHYDQNGTLIGTVEERDYSRFSTNKHRFYLAGSEDKDARYIECKGNSFRMGNKVVSYHNAFNAVYDAAYYGDLLYILDKDGTIRTYDGSSWDTVYSAAEDGGSIVKPYRIFVCDEGVFFSDIKNRAIRRVEKGKSAVVCADTDALCVSLDSDGNYILPDGGLAIRDSSDSVVEEYRVLQKNERQIAFQISWLICWIMRNVLGLILAFRLLLRMGRGRYATPQVVSFWVIGVVLAVTTIICWMLISSFSESYYEKLQEQVKSAAYMVANQIDVEDIQNIEETGGFGGSSYNELIRIMDSSFNADVDFYRQVYCNILTLDETGEEGYSIAYLDQSIGDYYPLDETETEELKQVYDTKKEVSNTNVEDVSGTYLSIKVPVFDRKGNVGGAVSVGAETYIIDDIVRDLQIKVLMSIIIVVMMIWLITTEASSFATNMDMYRRNIKEGETDALPGHLIRLLIFLIFSAYNMTATFLPVFLLRRANIFPARYSSLLGALPITVNIFIIGIMSLFCARLVSRYGISKVTYASTVFSLLGNVLMFAFPYYYTIALGLVLDGIGVGLVTNSVYVLITYIKDDVNRTWGLSIYNSALYSGINFGMMTGSILAVAVGQRTVFAIVGVMWFLLLLLSRFLLRQMEGLFTQQEEEQAGEESRISSARFVFNRAVASFILLIQNPYIVFGSFVFYFVPLYCDRIGVNETICSIFIMLYSQVAALFGDYLTRRFKRKFKDKAMYFAIFANVCSVAVFCADPSITTLVLALIIMGLGASFGKPVQQSYFLGLDQVRRYGEDKSIGVYNFSENIGESLGPVIFGRILPGGVPGVVTWIFLGIVSAMAGGHFLINPAGGSEKKKKL